MKTEPIVTVATITGLVSAIIALLVAFGVNFTEAQTTAIMGFVGVLAPLAVAFIARQWTVPLAKVEDALPSRETRVTDALNALQRASREA